MTKSITILGSTGSIGVSTLRVIRFLNDEFKVYGFSCRKNIKLLEEQIREFMPSAVAVESEDILSTGDYKSLKSRYPGIDFFEGADGVVELAGKHVDIMVSGIVGAAGLKPSLEAVKFSKRIALANKETLVMAGDLFISEIERNGVELIPIDSEHNAIFSLIKNFSLDEIERIVLTASGGSLRELSIDKLDGVTPAMALNHPTWNMGSKITIDSATMMNKGLEVIEAHYLFNVPYDNIDVIIHPESIIHSMVESIDGSIYAHMGVADMSLPILSALKYPEKVRNNFGRLNLEKAGSLNFFACDRKRYPALDLCYEAGRSSGTMPAVLNAANEVAVEAFLNKEIQFSDIIKIVEQTMNMHNIISDPSLEDIFNSDMESREISRSILSR